MPSNKELFFQDNTCALFEKEHKLITKENHWKNKRL